MRPKPARIVALLALAFLLAGAGALLRLRASLRQELEPSVATARPLTFAAIAPLQPLEEWGGAEVDGVAVAADALLTAGGAGVDDGTGRFGADLPTRRAAAIALWRQRPVVALAAGGLFERLEGRWHEARSGFGTLHVRCLVEAASGELWIGAREGLFRAPFGASRIERLDGHPVRAVALAGAAVLAGGEEGLRTFEGRQSTVLPTSDPWIESLGVVGDQVFAVTATGLERGPLTGPLAAVPGAEDVVQGASWNDRFYAVTSSPPSLRRYEAAGAGSEERLGLGDDPRRVIVAGGALFVDGRAGLWRRSTGSFVLARPRSTAFPDGGAHVTALARLGDALVAGLFDGGLIVAEAARRGEPLVWREVPGSAAWGVNALLPAGGELYVASLRGAARFDGRRLTPIEGPGAAFSLATSPDGVVIGYAQGVLLPGPRLLSAFHGLPGNQALALASGDALFVGTPSGLGAVKARRVAWRVAPGDGALPHPWVTALDLVDGDLYVGTYGGGLTRRTRTGRYEPFVETEGLKVNAGCLARAGGRLFAGTDGRGLWRISGDRARFDPVRGIALPSPRVTALLDDGDALLVGTDEGLARLPLTEPGRTFADGRGD
jgi:hypothetical protein